MNPSYDCIVIGAGPAGATAARELATGNARVLLLDRATFPRHKPCGGGVLVSAAAQLPFSLDPVTERVVTGFRVRYKRRYRFAHQFDRPLALMTQRARLDAFLVQQAERAGARFQDGRAVAGVELQDGGVTVRFNGGDAVTARAAVAADGANGAVRPALGLPPLRRAVALEANVQGVPASCRDAIELDLGSLPGGYGWIFPKADHCNVGVGGWPVAGPSLRRALNDYVVAAGIDPDHLRDHRGHHLPLRDPGATVAVGPVAFVGDAAGLVDPLSGEGIGTAIRSGALAATEIARLLQGAVPDLAGYQRELEAQIEPQLRVSRQLQALFHHQPWPYVQMLHRSQRFWRTFCQIVTGDATYVGFKARLGPLAAAVDAAAWYAQRGVARSSGWS